MELQITQLEEENTRLQSELKAEREKMKGSCFICQFCGRRNDNIFEQRKQKQEIKNE